ncbi:MAG TPA: nicotinate-nucleotide adenylyltransferase [Firmicutes bacterium]|nr:nicotinate-nucleotide adenylyltransferase [Bacillota bacterium]
MKTKKPRVGVMGGTFDPIHYGHLVTAEGARCEYDLDHVLFLPSRPPHKDLKKVTCAEHRYMMTVLATLTNPYFEVSRIDIDRKGASYTVDTLQILREKYGTETELFFITGADAVFEIIDWKDSEQLLKLAHFIAASRPGFSFEELPAESRAWINAHEDRFHILQIPAMAISSTSIRERVRAGLSVRYLVPEQVDYYIRRHLLYGQSRTLI